jgi:hypothetical protein
MGKPIQFAPDTTTINADNDSAVVMQSSVVAKWRLPPEDSYSDWTVEVLVAAADPHPTSIENGPSSSSPQEAEEEEHIRDGPGALYHVHKERLGTGPRSSLYFAKVFRSQTGPEGSAAVEERSIVTLPKKAAECFPALLDFIYKESSNVYLDTPASAAAMRYMANLFGMKELFDNVNNTFISSNMSNETVVDYVHEAIRYGDESLGKVASLHLVKAITSGSLQWTKAMASLPLSTLFEIASRVKKSPNFGRIIIEYVKADGQCVTSENVSALLNHLCIQFIEQYPLEILQVMERYELPSSHRARRSCVAAIGKTWGDHPYLRGSKLAKVSGAGVSYAALSDAQKVEILEKSIQCAYDDREDKHGKIQNLQDMLQSATLERASQRRNMAELRNRTSALELELELAKCVGYAPSSSENHPPVVYNAGGTATNHHHEKIKSSSSRASTPPKKVTPATSPNHRSAFEEVGAILTVTALAASVCTFTKATLSKTLSCTECPGIASSENHFDSNNDFTHTFSVMSHVEDFSVDLGVKSHDDGPCE